MAKRLPLSVILVTAGLLALTGFAAWGAATVWRLAGPARVSVHGYVAMVIAGVGVTALAAVLIWLAYYSERAGFDARQGEADDEMD